MSDEPKKPKSSIAIAFALGASAGSAGTYAAKPTHNYVEIPYVEDIGTFNCTPFGEQFADGGYAEICRPKSSFVPTVEPEPTPAPQPVKPEPVKPVKKPTKKAKRHPAD